MNKCTRMGVKLDISAFFVSTSIKLEEDKKLESENQDTARPKYQPRSGAKLTADEMASTGSPSCHTGTQQPGKTHYLLHSFRKK